MIHPPGTVLHNRYRIVQLLSQGGFGTLYRAWDITLSRPCALKENLDSAPQARRQFLREAKILAQLNHPNLPRVTDYFVEGSHQYLVMDYVEGQDLQEMLEARGGPLSEEEVLPWIGQICDALTYLHSQKPPVIHRDIKPANIKITPQGSAVLVDFGIAKTYLPHQKTTEGARAVTPGFSPYEQYGHGATDARSDLYALGATLYTLLTGAEPPESIQRVTRDPLTPPRRLNPNLSLRTAAAIQRALQMDPAQRFQSAAEFKAALLPVAPPRPAKTGLPQKPSAPPPTPVTSGWSHSWPLLALAGSLLLFSIALLVTTFSGRRPSTALPSTPYALLATTPHSLLPTNTSLPSAAPSPTPTEVLEFIEYTVQAGDTCSQIAQTFAVPIAQIAALNGLPPDCGVIYAGQTLLIPHQANAAATLTSSPPLAGPSATGSLSPPLATQIAAEDGMELVFIPAGEFWMGATEDDPLANKEEKPRHAVYLGAFWIDRTEVTNAMYARCVAAGVCRPPSENSSSTRPRYFDNPAFANYPVIYVSWEDAHTYCRWVKRRLPSEAEWEKAARGADERRYPWGEEPPTAQLANFNRQVGDTTPVGSYPAGSSPYGVLDLAGNVAEWVFDWYGEQYYLQSPYRNPSGPPTGEFRILRGGSWYNLALAMRTTFRLWNYPATQTNSIGFRCAK